MNKPKSPEVPAAAAPAPAEELSFIDQMREALAAFELKEGNHQYWEARALLGSGADPAHSVECAGTRREKEEAIAALLASGELKVAPYPDTLPPDLRRYQIHVAGVTP
jgi:hypothetical protein